MMTLLQPPDLYATLQDGKVIGLYNPSIRWLAANEPYYLMGRREPYCVSVLYPEVYELTFLLPYQDARLAAPEARLDINGVRFTIDSISFMGDAASYTATGWPIQIAQTAPTDNTPTFPGWEDVGHEYLDDRYDDYDHET